MRENFLRFCVDENRENAKKKDGFGEGNIKSKNNFFFVSFTNNKQDEKTDKTFVLKFKNRMNKEEE